jgi:uncharacterized delta-60 repeat protein
MHKAFGVKFARVLIIAALLSAFLVSRAQAVDGILDLSFGTGGKVALSLAGTAPGDLDMETYGQDLLVLPDGKFLVAGNFFAGKISYNSDYGVDLPNGYYDVFLARYCADGRLDNGSNCGSPAFGTNGITTLRVSSTQSMSNPIIRMNLVQQSTGKVVMVGDSQSDANFFIARFTDAGAVDTTFGGGTGYVLQSMPGVIHAVTLLEGDKLLLGGYESGNSLIVWRFNSDGSLDTSFNSTGYSKMQIGGSSTTINTMGVTSEGKIILGGYNASGANLLICRLTSNGALDGTYLNNIGGGITDLIILPGDKILATGYTYSGPNPNSVLLRLNADLSADTGFDGDSGSANGVLITNVNPTGGDFGREILIQSDGKYLMAGTYNPTASTQGFAFTRFESDGKIDATFGTNGIFTDWENSGSYTYDVVGEAAILPSGKLLLTGSYGYTTGEYGELYYYDTLVMRYGGFGGPATVTISGSAGIGGATLSYNDGGAQTATADGSGAYTITVPVGWSGTVTPSKTGYTFSPISKTYANLAADASSENYVVTSCKAPGSGLVKWEDAFGACPAGAKLIIPDGLNVYLTGPVSFSADFEIETGGTFDPKTFQVTLNGSTAQTIKGSPLTFYNLRIEKDGAANSVTVTGKLKVTKKLTVAKGKLISASDYMDIEILADGELILTNDITVGGDFSNAGTLTTDGHKITFDGAIEQNLTLYVMTWFDDLEVSAGTTLIETETDDNALVNGTLTNAGVLRKSQVVGLAEAYYFGLAGRFNGADMEINVTDLAGGTPLTSIQVDRIDQEHSAKTGTVGAGVGWGHYWTITPTGTDFTADVTLPHDIDPQTGAKVCRYTGTGLIWDCKQDGVTVDTVTYAGTTQFSDWAVGNHVDPTAVTVMGYGYSARFDGIELQWEMGLETSTVGFNIYRKAAGENFYVRLNAALLPVELSDGGLGGIYTYADLTARPGVKYTYKLERVDIDQMASETYLLNGSYSLLFLSFVNR